MSVPTRVLENGQWVTRLLDPYQILARNRTQLEEKLGPVSEPLKPPCRAVLTQTLAHSPIFKLICPARIRHQDRNDVLFVSDNAIQIREAYADYTLDVVTIKSGLDAPIRTSKIFGLPREPTKTDLSAILKEEDEESWLKDANASKFIHADSDGDAFEYDGENSVKPEDTEEAGIVKGEASLDRDPLLKVLSASCSNPSHPKDPYLPPQILVSVLENSKLLFVHSTSGRCDCSDLVASERPLPVSPSRLYQLGEHLAVDPR